jgi:hypothetical protein
MSSRRQFLLALAALVGCPRLALAARSANLLQLRVEYAATSLIETDGPTTPGRLWRTPSALRYDGPQFGHASTVIARLDRNLGWLVMPESRLAFETDLSVLDVPIDVLNGGGSMRQTREGRERVNGLDTIRIRVERNTGSGSHFAGYVWATDEGVIARLAGKGESRGRRGRTLMNFRDVQIGALDPGLFEVPRGVQIIQVKGGDLAAFLAGMEATGQNGLRR